MAAGDKAFEKMLERYDSPSAVAKALRELRTKMDSGELKAPAKPLAADAKPEEIAAWRKEQGLPADATALVAGLKLADGVVPGEADEPLLSSFAELGLKNNWSQETYNQAVDWYYQLNDQLEAKREEGDSHFHTSSVAELKGEWGKEFDGNINAIGNLMALFPEDVRTDFLLARMPDGTLLGDHPQVNRMLLMLSKELNPAATVLPAAAGSGISGVESRIAEIEGVMRDPKRSDQYWRGDSGAKMQEELRTLYEARDKMKARAA